MPSGDFQEKSTENKVLGCCRRRTTVQGKQCKKAEDWESKEQAAQALSPPLSGPGPSALPEAHCKAFFSLRPQSSQHPGIKGQTGPK